MIMRILDVQTVVIKTIFRDMIKMQTEVITRTDMVKIIRIGRKIVHIQIMIINIRWVNNQCREMIDLDIIQLVIKLTILSKINIFFLINTFLS